MYRQYQKPTSLEKAKADLLREREEAMNSPDWDDDMALHYHEQLNELEDNIRFAWDDDEFEENERQEAIRLGEVSESDDDFREMTEEELAAFEDSFGTDFFEAEESETSEPKTYEDLSEEEKQVFDEGYDEFQKEWGLDEEPTDEDLEEMRQAFEYDSQFSYGPARDDEVEWTGDDSIVEQKSNRYICHDKDGNELNIGADKQALVQYAEANGGYVTNPEMVFIGGSEEDYEDQIGNRFSGDFKALMFAAAYGINRELDKDYRNSNDILNDFNRQIQNLEARFLDDLNTGYDNFEVASSEAQVAEQIREREGFRGVRDLPAYLENEIGFSDLPDEYLEKAKTEWSQIKTNVLTERRAFLSFVNEHRDIIDFHVQEEIAEATRRNKWYRQDGQVFADRFYADIEAPKKPTGGSGDGAEFTLPVFLFDAKIQTQKKPEVGVQKSDQIKQTDAKTKESDLKKSSDTQDYSDNNIEERIAQEGDGLWRASPNLPSDLEDEAEDSYLYNFH